MAITPVNRRKSNKKYENIRRWFSLAVAGFFVIYGHAAQAQLLTGYDSSEPQITAITAAPLTAPGPPVELKKDAAPPQPAPSPSSPGGATPTPARSPSRSISAGASPRSMSKRAAKAASGRGASPSTARPRKRSSTPIWKKRSASIAICGSSRLRIAKGADFSTEAAEGLARGVGDDARELADRRSPSTARR